MSGATKTVTTSTVERDHEGNITRLHKVVRPGTTELWPKRVVSVYIKIDYKDGVLRLSGVEGPKSDGDCWGSCGQIGRRDVAKRHAKGEYIATYAPGWSYHLFKRLLILWYLHHLNDMRAGTAAQIEALRARYGEIPGYETARPYLESICLYDDNGSRYGAAWYREDVPQGVLEQLAAMPDTDKEPAWV